MKNSIYILACAFLVSACGQGSSGPDNKQSTKTDTSPDKKGTAVNAKTMSALDSIEKANNKRVIASGDKLNKAYVSLPDSSISLTAHMRLDHRIFGYASPDIKSERLLLLSIFTNDVQNNPFACKLGAYYDTGGMGGVILKYLGTVGNFVKAVAIDRSNKPTILYFEKKWIEFE